MADSTTNLPQIDQDQAGHATTANELIDALSVASYFGRNADACAGLTWGYLGGMAQGVRIPNGTLTLTASQANIYIERTLAGVVSFNTSAFTAGSIPLYKVVTGTDSVSSYEDLREPTTISSVLSGLTWELVTTDADGHTGFFIKISADFGDSPTVLKTIYLELA